MKTVKQPAGSKCCFAACVAMLAGVTLDEVLAEVTLHPEGWLPLSEALLFLAKRKIMLGMCVDVDDLRIDPTAAQIKLNVTFDVCSTEAIAIVESNAYPGFDHAVAWDNIEKKFRDPCPDEGELTEPADYTIKQWLVAYEVTN